MGRILGILVAIAVIAAGWYFYTSGGPSRRSRLRRSAATQATETAQQAAETAGQAAQQATEAAKQVTQAAAETAQQATQAATEAAQQAAQTATQTAQQAATAATEAAQNATQAATEAAQQVADGAQALVVGGLDLGKEVTGVVDGLKASLTGITDAASAQAQLPTLQQLQTKLDGVTASVEGLPAAAKTTLASLVSTSLPTLRSSADSVTAIQGVGEIVKPTLDAILAKLDTWAKAQG